MPLYYMLSLGTIKFVNSEDQFRKQLAKSARRLIMPGVFIWLLRSLLFYKSEKLFQYITSSVNTLLWAHASTVTIGSNRVRGIGAVYFLFSLFWARGLLQSVHMMVSNQVHLDLLCVLLGICGNVIPFLKLLPQSWNIALVVQPFYPIGKYSLRLIKTTKFIVLWCICLFLTCLIIHYSYDHHISILDIGSSIYPPFPIWYLTATLGNIIICGAGYFLSLIPYINNVTAYIGRRSLRLFLIHSIDSNWKNIWNWSSRWETRVLMRLSSNGLLFLTLSGFSWNC